MLRIKMHSIYDHFPECHPVEGEPYIEMYNDNRVLDCKWGHKNVAILFEPKSMIPDAYKFCGEHPELFRYIFTHDSELLKLPNAREVIWADVWLTTDSEKDKGVSLCTSYKKWCPLHRARLSLAKEFDKSGLADVFYGDWNNPKVPEVAARAYLEHYKYSIIIENDIDEFWYTEKILNCFATKTVPIYVGATRIQERFNANGIIQVSEWMRIPSIVEWLDLEADYNNRIDAINDNFERVEPYKTPWKQRFFNDYGELLEDLQNER